MPFLRLLLLSLFTLTTAQAGQTDISPSSPASTPPTSSAQTSSTASTPPNSSSGNPTLLNPVAHPPLTSPPVLPPEGEPVPEGSETERSVVQITNAFVEPSWDMPWQLSPTRTASGTGFLIAGDRIMTNAHVVAWNTRLLVRKYHDPHEYQAHVEFVGHDVDLAVLKVDEPDFYTNMTPLDFGDLPKVRSSVVTYGFPAGGEQISYTRGVVSRIEVQDYVHIGNRSFLACQTDAAINPGNSGGPVIQDGKVVGVAFEGVNGLQSTGYFIPTVIIHHFLDDIATGSYHGAPDSGLQLVSLQNPSYRTKLKLPNNTRGVLIDSVLDIPTTQALIKPNDVLLQVGDYPVDEDGTITYQDNTVGASVAFDLAQDGQSVPLKIWRDGQEVAVDLPMKVYHDDYTLGNQYDVKPPYYIYGGLVFTALSLDYLRSQGDQFGDSGRDLIYELLYRHKEDPKNWRPQPVVLASILNNPVNADFRVRARTLVNKINGRKINSLADVIQAFTEAKGPLSTIEFSPDNHLEVIRNADAEKANPDILQSYNIYSDRNL